MTAIQITQIYNYLASVFGKDTAEKHIDYLKQMSKGMENESQLPVTKDDLYKEGSRLDLRISETKVDLVKEIANAKVELMKEIANVKVELMKEIANVKTELMKEIANVKTELMKEIANFKGDIIKWMFIFWIGQAGIIIGLIFHFLKK
jgi:hypothetical protein